MSSKDIRAIVLLVCLGLGSACSLGRFDPSDTMPFNILGVRLNMDSLDDVTSSLGQTTTNREKFSLDAFEPIEFCYVGKDETMIVFHMGWALNFQKVTGYSIFGPGSERMGCTMSGKVSEKIFPNIGLKLGASPERVKRIFGEPIVITGDTWHYYFSSGEDSPAYEDYKWLGVDVAFGLDQLVEDFRVRFGNAS